MTPLISITISLPIPDRRISPNASRGESRGAAISKARIVRSHRNKAKIAFLAEMGQQNAHGIKPEQILGYGLAHYFKTNNFRDDDNADGACKAYRDGVADALGLDDRKLRKCKLSTLAKDAANPRVELTVYLKNDGEEGQS